MKPLNKGVLILIVLLIIIGGVSILSKKDSKLKKGVEVVKTIGIDFSTNITNPYFSLPVGRVFTYEGKTKEGVERVEISIPGETEVINGVTTLVYRDKVWLNGEMIEDTRDFLAQDKEGNVWYFGEEVDNYEDGVLIDHNGSWRAGMDGAVAGIWMKAVPVVGTTYKQEYLKGEAEDMADIISVTEKLTISGKSYSNCLKTYDYTPLDPESKEYKFYCKEVGNLVLEENILTGEKVELLSVK